MSGFWPGLGDLLEGGGVNVSADWFRAMGAKALCRVRIALHVYSYVVLIFFTIGPNIR